jgi:GntR family transcriptional regulator
MDIRQLKMSDLPITTVDPHSPVPLYHQINLDLRRLIQSGAIPPGALIPPEMEICQAYGVGRQTVRQAIAYLVDDNLVERFAGRGTFVRAQADRTRFYLDRSFSQLMRDMGRTPRSQVLSMETSTLSPGAPAAFQKWQGAPCLTLERLRFGDDEPICHQTTTVLTNRCPGIEAHDFATQALYEVLANEYHLFINRIDHVVRAVAADEYRAELLGVPEGAPLLFVATTTYLEDGQVIEHTASYYRADRYEYSTSHTRREE